MYSVLAHTYADVNVRTYASNIAHERLPASAGIARTHFIDNVDIVLYEWSRQRDVSYRIRFTHSYSQTSLASTEWIFTAHTVGTG